MRTIKFKDASGEIRSLDITAMYTGFINEEYRSWDIETEDTKNIRAATLGAHNSKKYLIKT